MAFRKRKLSVEVIKANKRRDGLRSIHENLDLMNGLTTEGYQRAIDNTTSLTEEYNILMSQLDGVKAKLATSEKNLADWSKRMLNGVGCKYGYDSIEYEKAGGIRKSARKHYVRKKNKAQSAG